MCVCACVCVLRRRLSGQGCLRPGDSPAPSSRGHPANWSNWSKRKLPRIIMIALYYIIIRTGLLPVRGLAGSLPSSRNETVVSPDRRRRVSRWTPPPAAATARGKYWSNWYCWSNTGQTGIAGQILVKLVLLVKYWSKRIQGATARKPSKHRNKSAGIPFCVNHARTQPQGQ